MRLVLTNAHAYFVLYSFIMCSVPLNYAYNNCSSSMCFVNKNAAIKYYAW